VEKNPTRKKIFNYFILILIIGLLLFFKIWQAGESFKLENTKNLQKIEIVNTCNEIKMARSNLALASTPEYLVWLSSYLNVPLERITFDDLVGDKNA